MIAIIVAIIFIMPLFFNSTIIKGDSNPYLTTVQCGENAYLTYDSYNKTVTISGTGTMYNRRIDYAPTLFYEDVQKVVIEEGITEVGNDAFSGCGELWRITFSNTVLSLNGSSFKSCYSLESVSFPSSLKYLRDGAFEDCSILKNVKFDSETVYCEVGYATFRDCIKLKNVELTDNVNLCGGYCFQNCKSLEKIVLPSATTKIGTACFWGCSALKYADISSLKEDTGYSTFAGCISLEEVVLSDELRTITNSFKDCTSLKNINIPSSLESISFLAFDGCISLEEMHFPSSLKEIGNSAFANCTGLNTVTFGDGAIDLKVNAFQNCSNLKKLSFGRQEPKRVNNSFNGSCKALSDLTILNDQWITDYLKYIPVNGSTTVHCYLGSSAYMYAKEKGCKIDVVDGKEPPEGIEIRVEDEEDIAQYRKGEQCDVDLDSPEADDIVFTSSRDICKYITIKMKKQKRGFSVRASGKAADFLRNSKTDIDFLSNELMEEISKGDPFGGDYLRARVNKYTTELSDNDGKVYLHIKIDYEDNIGQEQVVRKFVENKVEQNNLMSNKLSPLEKLNIIYKLISQSVQYDYSNTESIDSIYSQSAYGAIVYKKALCKGYAQYLYALCKRVGIPVRIIYSKSHAWNLVSIDGGKTYFNIDVTYDSMQDGLSDDYYLKSDLDIKKGSNIRDRLDVFNTKQFRSMYPVAEKSYYTYIKDGAKGHWVYTVLTNKRVSDVVEAHTYKNGTCIYCGYRKEIRKPNRTVIKKIKRKKSAKKITIKLKKVKNATGYQVKVLKKKKGKVLVTKYVKKTKFSIKSKKFKGKKKLYVKARAYILDEKIKVFGAWSKVKVSKIK